LNEPREAAKEKGKEIGHSRTRLLAGEEERGGQNIGLAEQENLRIVHEGEVHHDDVLKPLKREKEGV